jgi:hypothetical protein
MAKPATTAKRPSRRSVPKENTGENSVSRRELALHFRLNKSVAQALEKAAVADRRSVSAWVAICVEDRLREGGYLA